MKAVNGSQPYSMAGFLLLLLLLPACATSIETMNQEALGWIGEPVSDLVVSLGPPDKREAMEDGITIRQWLVSDNPIVEHHDYRGNPYHIGPDMVSETIIRSCIITVVSRDGKITNFSYDVNNDTAVGFARDLCPRWSWFENGITPLHYEACTGDVNMVKALLNAGADIEAKDKNGATPLDCAKDEGHTDVVNILKEAAQAK